MSAGPVPAGGCEVLVLLATYNGERYLREQIDSVLAQSYRPVRILARDDGSTDGTRAVLEEYARRHPTSFLLLPATAPTGSARDNFLLLVRDALELEAAEPGGASAYMACCDQDDIWLPNKLELEMEAMRELEARRGGTLPALVFSNLSVTEADGRLRHPSLWQHGAIDPGTVRRLNRLLLQNVVTGCTMLFNRPLAELAQRMPPEAFMHDWWMALLCCLFGEAAILNTPTVLYRQHGGNVIGAVEARPRSLVPKLREHGARRLLWEQGAHQAVGLLRSHGAEMSATQRRVVEAMVRCEQSRYRVARVWTCVRYGFFYRSWRANLAMLWYLWDMDHARRTAARG